MPRVYGYCPGKPMFSRYSSAFTSVGLYPMSSGLPESVVNFIPVVGDDSAFAFHNRSACWYSSLCSNVAGGIPATCIPDTLPFTLVFGILLRIFWLNDDSFPFVPFPASGHLFLTI